MSFPLKLDSSTLNQDADEFTIIFPQSITLNSSVNDAANYEIGLVTADLWYTFHNITSKFGNNTFRYYNGSAWRNITLPNGNYEVSDINDYLLDQMDVNSDYTTDTAGEKVYSIQIEPNVVTTKVVIKISNSYQIDLSTSDLYSLLGFNSAIYSATTSSPNRVDITRGVNNLVIHCSLATGSYDNSLGSDVVYTFVPQTGRGSAIHVEPNTPVYVPISEVKEIKKITMRITDQQNRKINFNGDPVTYFLHIRQRRKI